MATGPEGHVNHAGRVLSSYQDAEKVRQQLHVLIPLSARSRRLSFSAAPGARFLRGRLHFTAAL